MYKKTRILLGFVLLLLVIALGGKSLGYKDVPLNEIKENVIKEVDSSKFVDGDTKALKRFYGLNEKDYEEVVFLMPSSTMEVSELLIIKVKDDSQIDGIESSMESRIESQGNSFKDYAPEQYGIIQENELSIKGNYVFLAISEDAQKMKDAFLKSIK